MALKLDRFQVEKTPLRGLMRVQRQFTGDNRGTFSRLFCADSLSAINFTAPVVQINITLTHAIGAIRGLHFQYPPHAEDKYVSCLHGEIFDVAVDLRAGSPTFLHWHSEILSSENARSLLIPKGFAHGFQTLSNDCELLYLHTAAYSAGAESALNVCDPRLAIDWPLPFSELSDRDRQHPLLSDHFTGI
jgi:dTDP-4-dehydrorhamnose 3,5-epimerase